MAAQGIILLRGNVWQRLTLLAHTHQFSTSSLCCAGAKWRLKRGMPRSGNEYGPLTDLPDWSYVDGRPAPLNFGQFQRKNERIALAKRIVELSAEMDQAREEFANRQSQNSEETRRILNNKLRPKQGLEVEAKR